MKPGGGLGRRATGLVVTLGTLVAPMSLGAADGPAFPRLANVWLHGAVRDEVLPELARWDVLVLDPVWTPEQLARLRVLNPAVRLFAYVCPYCIHVPPNRASPWEMENYQYALVNGLWWYDGEGRIAADWPRTQMINPTALAPEAPQGPWRSYLAARLEALLQARPALDGIFFDNFWRGISWEQEVLQLDSDCNPLHRPAGCDSTPDTPARLDSLWNAALRELARNTRARLDGLEAAGRQRPLALLGNGVSDYFEWLNGAMYERFPEMGGEPDPGNPHGYRWSKTMFGEPGGYLQASFRSDPYVLQIVNAAAAGGFEAPERTPRFERHKRFTLCATLLGDGYYSLDPAERGHGALWWEPEFDHDGRGRGYLGWPKGAATRTGPDGTGLLRRDFDRGIVLVNDTARVQTATLERTCHRLRIRGSRVFDGAAVRRERVPPYDGRILLYRSTEPDEGANAEPRRTGRSGATVDGRTTLGPGRRPGPAWGAAHR